MSEPDLRCEIEELRRAIDGLCHAQQRARTGAWLGVLGGCVAGFLAVGVLFGSNPAQAGGAKTAEVVCRALRVVDAAGKTRLLLQVKDDQPEVDLLTGAGRRQLHLAGNDHGATVLLFGKDGTEHLSLGVLRKTPGGILSLHDGNGIARLTLAADQRGGLVNVMSKDNQREVFLGSSQEGGGLHLYGPRGGLALMLEAGSAGGRLRLNAADAKPRFVVDIDKNGTAGLDILNKDGNSLVVLSADAEGGLLDILGQDNKDRVFLGVGEKKGGGFLALRDPAGTKRLAAGASPDGGFVELLNGEQRRLVFLGSNDRGGQIAVGARQGSGGVAVGVDRDGLGFVEARDRKGTPCGSLK